MFSVVEKGKAFDSIALTHVPESIGSTQNCITSVALTGGLAHFRDGLFNWSAEKMFKTNLLPLNNEYRSISHLISSIVVIPKRPVHSPKSEHDEVEHRRDKST